MPKLDDKDFQPIDCPRKFKLGDCIFELHLAFKPAKADFYHHTSMKCAMSSAEKMGEMEDIDGNMKHFTNVSYWFHKDQNFSLHLFEGDAKKKGKMKKLGKEDFKLSALIGTDKGFTTRKVPTGTLEIRVKELDASRRRLKMHLTLKGLDQYKKKGGMNKEDMPCIFIRVLKVQPDLSTRLVYQTETETATSSFYYNRGQKEVYDTIEWYPAYTSEYELVAEEKKWAVEFQLFLVKKGILTIGTKIKQMGSTITHITKNGLKVRGRDGPNADSSIYLAKDKLNIETKERPDFPGFLGFFQSNWKMTVVMGCEKKVKGQEKDIFGHFTKETSEAFKDYDERIRETGSLFAPSDLQGALLDDAVTKTIWNFDQLQHAGKPRYIVLIWLTFSDNDLKEFVEMKKKDDRLRMVPMSIIVIGFGKNSGKRYDQYNTDERKYRSQLQCLHYKDLKAFDNKEYHEKVRTGIFDNLILYAFKNINNTN